MSTLDLSAVLTKALSRVGADQKWAEQQLQIFRDQDLSLFLLSLCAELCNVQREGHLRSLAGLILKNSLDAQDPDSRTRLNNAWVALPQATRDQIKAGVLHTLSSPERQARDAAAQAVAKIAKIELPRNMWPPLIDTLLGASAAPQAETKQAALETLGYICEELNDENTLRLKANLILGAVVNGMRKEEPSEVVRKAAATAFYNALQFVEGNFNDEGERNIIMTVVCDGVSAPQAELRRVFYECLVKIATLYYDKLGSYIQAIFSLTLATMRSDEPAVVLQAIEFWCTICEEEYDLLEEIADGSLPPTACPQYIRGALKFLVAPLTETLAKQEDDTADDDDRTPPIAAATCLSLIANVVGDDVVPEVMVFVQQHINNPDWHYREAATMAFGSVLDGPKEYIQQLISQAIPILLEHMRDQSISVKDTTAWTLGRICECHPAAIVPEQFPRMIQTFIVGLQDDPRIASSICWSLHNLANAYDSEATSSTGPLSVYFTDLMRVLLTATERKESKEFKYRSAAYESMNALIQYASQDVINTIVQLVPVFLERLKKTFEIQVLSADDRDEQNDLQSLLCSVLQVTVQKLGQRAKPFADQMMLLFLQVFAFKSATLHEEALMAVGALANACEVEFEKYMAHLRPHLIFGLSNWEEHTVCMTAVGVVGDVCRAIGDKVLPFCDEFVSLMLQNLQNGALNRNVKPMIISTLGDIALAISGQFEKYFSVVMSMLAQASLTLVNVNFADQVEFLNELRISIFEAYTGIAQGLRSDNKAQLLEPYVDGMFVFMDKCFKDSNSDAGVRRAALGTLGDLTHALGGRIKRYLQQEWVRTVVNRAIRDPNDNTKEVATWVKSVLEHAMR